MGDDSIGLQVVRQLANTCNDAIRLVESHAGGLLLLEELAGARQAIMMGMPLPEDPHIHLVAIVAEDVSNFTESLSPRVAAALPHACRTVLQLIDSAMSNLDDLESA